MIILIKIKRINGKIGRNIELIIISTFQCCSKRRRSDNVTQDQD